MRICVVQLAEGWALKLTGQHHTIWITCHTREEANSLAVLVWGNDVVIAEREIPDPGPTALAREEGESDND